MDGYHVKTTTGSGKSKQLINVLILNAARTEKADRSQWVMVSPNDKDDWVSNRGTMLCIPH